MMAFVRSWWNRKRRDADLQILWPAFCEAAEGDLPRARGMMLLHASEDDAWSDLSETEVRRIIEGLD